MTAPLLYDDLGRLTVDVSILDSSEFNVREFGDVRLITPTESKHVWGAAERPLRSVVLDRENRVLSSGFPKFHNVGEVAEMDQLLYHFIDRGDVVYAEKLDGSLIIADFDTDGQIRFRTRGQVALGAFEDRVMSVVRSKYPNLLVLAETLRLERYSLLFEYIGPQNQIVVRYPDEDLVLLGLVDKWKLRPAHAAVADGQDRTILDSVTELTGIRQVRAISLPRSAAEAIEVVKGWGADVEGVVACFSFHGWSWMVKIKSAAYVRLHGLKFRLEGNVGKLLYLLEATTAEEAQAALFGLGIDYEAQAFVAPEIIRYVVKRSAVLEHYRRLVNEVDTSGTRKDVVIRLRRELAERALPEVYFHAALKAFDGKATEAVELVMATEVLEIPVGRVRQWRTEGQAKAIAELMHTSPQSEAA